MVMDKTTDTANEPVDSTDDGDFMDTGVLHERCTDVSCQLTHPHPKEQQ